VTCYLLDTDVLIDFSKNREPARSRITAWIAAGDDLGVCPVNVAEFYAGLSPTSVVLWDVFFSTLLYWDISLPAAKRAGAWRYQFARRGTPLSVSDTLVGAVALEQGATIVTNSVKDYPMGGLHLLSLRP